MSRVNNKVVGTTPAVTKKTLNADDENANDLDIDAI